MSERTQCAKCGHMDHWSLPPHAECDPERVKRWQEGEEGRAMLLRAMIAAEERDAAKPASKLPHGYRRLPDGQAICVADVVAVTHVPEDVIRDADGDPVYTRPAHTLLKLRHSDCLHVEATQAEVEAALWGEA